MPLEVPFAHLPGKLRLFALAQILGHSSTRQPRTSKRSKLLDACAVAEALVSASSGGASLCKDQALMNAPVYVKVE